MPIWGMSVDIPSVKSGDAVGSALHFCHCVCYLCRLFSRRLRVSGSHGGAHLLLHVVDLVSVSLVFFDLLPSISSHLQHSRSLSPKPLSLVDYCTFSLPQGLQRG